MMTVLGCVVDQHDLLLVLVAAIVCALGSYATVSLCRRADATTAVEKRAWLVLTGVVAGAAIWCTHFIAMLGYKPGVPVSFDAVMTVGSLFAATIGAVAGFAIATSKFSRFAPALGGATVGLAVSVMHYTGMMAYRVQGIVSWDMNYLVASVIIATTVSAAAMHFGLKRDSKTDVFAGSGILVLAIVGLHFTGMTAFRVEPMLVDGSFSNPEALRGLALTVACVAFLVLGAGMASSMIDNSARTEAAEALNNMSNGLVLIAGDGTIRLFNERVIELFGLSEGSIQIGMSLGHYLRVVGASVGWDKERTSRVIANHHTWLALSDTTRIEHNFDDGTVLSIICRPMPDGGGVLTYEDVTDAREGQKQIRHMAFHDALTGLPNRRSFSEQTAQFSAGGQFVMLMLDLDRFKTVNDTLGHGIGDKLLTEVARRLRNACGPSNLLFRIGGDELAVLARISDCEAGDLGNSLIAAVTQPFRIDSHNLLIGGSVGIAMAEMGDAPELVQRKADLALYKAKENGRGRVEFYSDGMVEDAAQRRELEIELRAALRERQLELHYQPLFALPSCRISGFEALIRWRHPVRGLVSPAEFIPLAEQCGAILEIGAWVIDEACRQAAQWPADVYVSINISPVQLGSVGLLNEITTALDKHGLTPRRIEVEVTETAIVQNSSQIATVLSSLRALGVRIAMDDFGTGYSSLAHLRDFELDRIKIDRSFINATGTDSNANAVVRAVTLMAKEMSIETTAEGVENEEQLQSLIQIGCGTAQGFMLGKPLNAAGASDLLSSNTQSRRTARLAIAS